jgi:type IV secretory pathway VirJ component
MSDVVDVTGSVLVVDCTRGVAYRVDAASDDAYAPPVLNIPAPGPTLEDRVAAAAAAAALAVVAVVNPTATADELEHVRRGAHDAAREAVTPPTIEGG